MSVLCPDFPVGDSRESTGEPLLEPSVDFNGDRLVSLHDSVWLGWQ